MPFTSRLHGFEGLVESSNGAIFMAQRLFQGSMAPLGMVLLRLPEQFAPRQL